MATRKDVLEALNGFDVRFPIDYNDIDYCLRAVERGYRIVYTPYAELYHFEGQTSTRREASPQSTQLFRQRWAKYIANDPFYNPNLTRCAVDFCASSVLTPGVLSGRFSFSPKLVAPQRPSGTGSRCSSSLIP
jgi:GT2 family glycosyltransferase